EPIAVDDRSSCSSAVALQQPAAAVPALAGKALMATDMTGISRAARVTCARPGSDTGRTLRNVPLGLWVLVQPVIFCSFLIFVTSRGKTLADAVSHPLNIPHPELYPDGLIFFLLCVLTM
uniref:Uncharacterized protein n=1 Tax=Ficedula albicollis TaxID=59894 RepID=A0A803V1H6_FICAL